MRPRIDLTKSNRFTVWEQGGWDTSKRQPYGTSIIVGGPDGDCLPIAFDTNPKTNVTHCAFFGESHQVLAGAYITTVANKPGYLRVLVELSRIEQLTTALVQGHPVAKSVLKPLWVHSEIVPENEVVALFARYDPTQESHRESFQNMIKLALAKAMTLPEDQYFFWGIPRSTYNSQLDNSNDA